MKLTVKGILINVNKEAEIEINRLVTVFSSAQRYGFKRTLEGKLTDEEVGKEISTLNKDKNNRSIKIQVPLYLPLNMD